MYLCLRITIDRARSTLLLVESRSHFTMADSWYRVLDVKDQCRVTNFTESYQFYKKEVGQYIVRRRVYCRVIL